MDVSKLTSFTFNFLDSGTPRLPVLITPVPHRRTHSICKNTESRFVLSNSVNEDIFHHNLDSILRCKKPRVLKSLHDTLISDELTIALKHLTSTKNKPKKIKTVQKPSKAIAISSLMSRKAEEIDIQNFLHSVFSHEPSPYRKMGLTSEPEAIDLRAADKILQDAKKIIKHGVVKKSTQHEHTTQIEEFWKNQISREKCVRWDLFEEGFLVFLETFMVCSYGALRKVNWKTFFHKLYNKLSCELEDFTLWPSSPTTTSPKVALKLVKYSSFASIISSGDINRILLASLEEIPSYIENLRKGKGFLYCCGCFYKGEWKDGRKEGNGTMDFCSGDRYIGTFCRGLREDYGTFSSDSKYLYKGDFKRDKFHGYGKIRFPDGSFFEGLWIKNYFSNGRFEYGDGGIYTGEWAGYSFEGKGVLVLGNGTKKRGMWRNGKLCGEAKVSLPDGSVVRGFFFDDVLQDENAGEINEKAE